MTRKKPGEDDFDLLEVRGRTQKQQSKASFEQLPEELKTDPRVIESYLLAGEYFHSSSRERRTEIEHELERMLSEVSRFRRRRESVRIFNILESLLNKDLHVDLVRQNLEDLFKLFPSAKKQYLARVRKAGKPSFSARLRQFPGKAVNFFRSRLSRRRP